MSLRYLLDKTFVSAFSKGKYKFKKKNRYQSKNERTVEYFQVQKTFNFPNISSSIKHFLGIDFKCQKNQNKISCSIDFLKDFSINKINWKTEQFFYNEILTFSLLFGEYSRGRLSLINFDFSSWFGFVPCETIIRKYFENAENGYKHINIFLAIFFFHFCIHFFWLLQFR